MNEIDFLHAPIDTGASALKTVFEIPEIVTLPPGSNASESLYPASQYHLAPNDSAAILLERDGEARLSKKEREAFVEDVPSGARLQLLLRNELSGCPSNVYFSLSGIDENNEGMASGFNRWAALDGAETLSEATAMIAWASGDYAHGLKLGAVHERIEAATSMDFAADVVRTYTEALDYLMPVWDEAMTFAYIRDLHWFGYEDDRERIEEMKHDLAHSRDLDPSDISEEEARDAADGYFWTTPYVESVLHEPYRKWRRSEPAPQVLREKLEEHGLEEDLQLLDEAFALRKKTKAFVEKYDYGMNAGAGYNYGYRCEPWGLLATIDPLGFEGHSSSLIVETFEEQARHNAEAGETARPIAGLCFDASNAEGRASFFSFLTELKDCVADCRDFVNRLDPETFEETSSEGAAWKEYVSNLEEDAAQAKSSATLPAAFLNGDRQIKKRGLKVAGVLRALHYKRGDAHTTPPSEAVPGFL